jgi:Domain of unknown function (DUF397)
VDRVSSTPWIKASASADQGSCVQQRFVDSMIEVRDTKDQGAGPVLRFTLDEYAAWLDGAKRGEFDHLLWVDRSSAGSASH